MQVVFRIVPEGQDWHTVFDEAVQPRETYWSQGHGLHGRHSVWSAAEA
jgi:hypothetical protein